MYERVFRKLALYILANTIKQYKKGSRIERDWVATKGDLFKWCALVLNMSEQVLTEKFIQAFKKIDNE